MDLTKKYNSKLILIHVVDNSIGLDFFDRKEYLSLLRNYGQRVLKKCSKKIKDKKINYRTALKEGNVTKEIAEYAKKEGCDLIVIGNKGLGRVSRFFMGSVSNKVTHYARCPVLVVK